MKLVYACGKVETLKPLGKGHYQHEDGSIGIPNSAMKAEDRKNGFVKIANSYKHSNKSAASPKAVAAMSGAAGLVPAGVTRVIFEDHTALDMRREYFLEVCKGSSCHGKTFSDFTEHAVPAVPKFY